MVPGIIPVFYFFMCFLCFRWWDGAKGPRGRYPVSCFVFRLRGFVVRLGRYSGCPSIVPVVRYCACDIAWHIWEQPLVAVRGVAPVAAIVLVFPAGTIRRYRRTATLYIRFLRVLFLIARRRRAGSYHVAEVTSAHAELYLSMRFKMMSLQSKAGVDGPIVAGTAISACTYTPPTVRAGPTQ